MSKPKLALIPSGYKSGKVYSILPNDATGDFDFTRQSIGTRVRKDGLIEEAKTSGSITNLILNSEDFSTNWTNFNGASISTDQTLAPDGTNTADKIVSNGTNYSFTRPTSNITVTNAKYYTASIYVKADVETVGYIRCDYGTLIYNRKFDLTAGTLSTGFDNTGNIPENERIEELANGWYRVSITDVVDTISFEMRIYCADGSASSGDSLFLWGAMVSEGALSDYIKTEGTTETKTVETFTDVPRLDWYNSNCPSLLLEPQRTNYATNNTSMDTYSSVGGSNPSPTLTANYITAPDGTLTATRLQVSKTGTNYSLIGFPTTALDGSGGGYYTASVYVKSNTGSSQEIAFYGQSSSPNNRTVTTEWSRIQFTGQRLGNTKYAYLGTINGTDDDIDISVWGAQIELVDSYPSSLIYTGASAVTRLKDECLNGGDSDLFDITEGTFFADVTPYDNEGANTTYILLSDGSTLNRIIFIFYGNFNQVRFFLSSNASGSTVNYLSHFQSINFNQKNKLALTFKKDELKCYANGSLVHTISSALVPINLESLDFSSSAQNSSFFEGKVHDIRVYDRALTEAEAIQITTL